MLQNINQLAYDTQRLNNCRSYN